MHWAVVYQEFQEETRQQAPEGTKPYDTSAEKLMDVAEITHELQDDVIMIKIKVPLVYELNFEVLELVAVPNLSTKTIIQTPY